MPTELKLGMLVEYFADGPVFKRRKDHRRIGRVREIKYGFGQRGKDLTITLLDLETGELVEGTHKDVIDIFDMTKRTDVERWLDL